MTLTLTVTPAQAQVELGEGKHRLGVLSEPRVRELVPPPPPPAPTGPPDGFVVRSGDGLVLNGKPYRFTGVTAFSAATLWGVNTGCGDMWSDAQLDSFFAGLRPASMVKIHANQAMAFDSVNRRRDWRPIDRVVAAAERHGQKLIMSLATQAGECEEGHWKDQAWYDGGYRQAYNDNGLGLSPVSYWDYLHEVVPRYADSPAVGMWHLVVEPEPSNCHPGYAAGECFAHKDCPPGAAGSLRAFFDTVGGAVKAMDPWHPINSAVIGRQQCGAINDEYAHVHASPGIDVASYHDYGDDSPLPGNLAWRLAQSRRVGKPLIVDEAGIAARDHRPGCRNTASRRDLMAAKMHAQFAAGIVGFTPWNAHPVDRGAGCDFDILPNDPIFALIRDFPL